jgi:photosystem II stability/assembly factor-like uncharacterized protein
MGLEEGQSVWVRRIASMCGLLGPALVAVAGELALAQGLDPAVSSYQDLRWRLVGPLRGGWATCAEGIPEAPATYYFGAAAGGVWKTEDAGGTWKPIFDHESAASVGALAIAPSDPNVIYVGTGQIQARYDIASGDGVFRSDDGGKSWRSLGLQATRAIGRIHVDPRDPNVALVAALGHIFGPNKERGLFRTTDGGKSWSQVLSVNEETGGADLAADPENPDVIYASLWQVRNYPWLSYFQPAVGPGSGLYKSTDGGRTWARLQTGLPGKNLGRIGLAAARGGRVWALVDAGDRPGPENLGGLYRSDDAGASWTRVNATAGLGSSYINRVTSDPRNPDVVYVMGQSIRRSDDGGKTLQFFKGAPGGDDYHFLWINPKHPEFLVTAADQGTVVSVNGGKSWSDWYNQPTAQLYHVETDDRFPYWIYSGQQDSGTVGAASRSDYGSLTYRDWHPVGGEERGWDVPDPEDPEIVYGTGLGGTITRWDGRTGQVQNVSPAVESNYGARPTGKGLRWTWIFPLAISAKPPHAVYTGAQYLLRSLDRGASWERVSPDLSGAEPGTAGCDGEITVANARPCGFGVVFTIAISRRDDQEIWVGTDDGLVQLTRDGGRTWKNVTPKGLPVWGKVASLDLSATEAGVAYAAVDTHRLDDFTPHAYRTRDYGETWQEISAGLPPARFVTSLRADPVRGGLLYAGTDGGVSVSFDDGAHWQPLQLNLPTCWVGDLTVHGTDLIIATQGRGLWVLDDVTPLRQIGKRSSASSSAMLLAPADAVRVRSDMIRDTPLPADFPITPNPPAGAALDYVLAKPARSVHLDILTEKGETVRSFASDAPPEKLNANRYFPEGWVRPPEPPATSAGHHRFVWDLRYARPRADRYDYMIAAVWGRDTPLEPRGPLVLPGRYTVRLTVDGQRTEQPLRVTMDPRVTVAADALSAQLEFQRRVIEAMSSSSDALQAVRGFRAGLEKRREKAGTSGATGPVADAIAQADRDAHAIESGDAPGGGGRRRGGTGGLTGVNGTLVAIVKALDLSDTPPTAVQREGYDSAKTKLDELLASWKRLSEQGLAKVNAALRAKGLEALTAEEIQREAPEDSEGAGVEIE